MMYRQSCTSPDGTIPRSSSPEKGFVVGIDIGGTSLRVGLADSAGTLLAKWSASTVGLQDADAVVHLIEFGVRQLLIETGVPQAGIAAMAVGAPGVTNVDAGVVIATSYLLGWRQVPLQALLESRFAIPVVVDNDVNLAALGEGWRGAAKSTSDFVFIALGTGVGAGIMLGNQLLRGQGWTAGEIGYMLVPGTSVTPAAADMPGGLEKLIGGQGITNQWQASWHKGITNLPRTMIATDIFDHAWKGDVLAKKILDDTARILAYSIYNISLILNCPLFVLGGSIGMHPALCVAAQAILDERTAHVKPRVVRSALGLDAQLLGAICLALSTVERRR